MSSRTRRLVQAELKTKIDVKHTDTKSMGFFKGNVQHSKSIESGKDDFITNKLFQEILSKKSELPNLNVLLNENILSTSSTEITRDTTDWIPPVKEVDLIKSSISDFSCGQFRLNCSKELFPIENTSIRSEDSHNNRDKSSSSNDNTNIHLFGSEYSMSSNSTKLVGSEGLRKKKS